MSVRGDYHGEWHSKQRARCAFQKKKKNRATRQFSVFLRKVHACFSRTAVQGWVGKWQEIR